MSYIYKAFGWIMSLCYDFVEKIDFGGYALALLLFTLICQIILFPFGIKQQKNSQKQARLRPKENVIRRRYNGRTDRDSQMKMNEELQKLYQEEHFSPFSGCLPLLIQLPLILVLFNIIQQPLTYIVNMSSADLNAIADKLASLGVEAVKTAKGSVNELAVLNSIQDNAHNICDVMSANITPYINDIPDFQMWKINLAIAPKDAISASGVWYSILVPVITFLSAFFGQKLTHKFTYQPTNTGESASTMKLMNFMMPLFSAYLAYTWFAAMGLYWTYRSILSFVQQVILSRMYPVHKFTDAELQAEEKAYLAKLKGKSTYKPAPSEIKGRKSLIFDDDEDEVEVPENAHSIVDDDDYTSSDSNEK